MNANGPGAAADALEVMVGKAADGEGSIKHETPDAISTSDVVHAAFHLPPGKLGRDAFCDGFRVVVIAVLNHHQANALGVVLGTCPNALSVVFADHDDERCTVQPAKVCEGPSGVTRTGADEALAVMIVHALDGWNRFHVLETPRGAQTALLRPVAVEGDPEVGKSHHFS